MQDVPWLVTDARNDPRTLTNPLVAGEFGLQFYLGVPLHTHDGFNLGMLCVLDMEPRTISQEQINHLKDLASVVMDQLELRLSARRSLAEKDAAYRQAQLLAKEIDHRGMNSLQLIASMLNVQSAQLRGTEAAHEIAKAAGKIVAVAHVHQHMHLDQTVTTMDCAEYLARLCAGLSEMLGSEERGTISVKATPMSLPSEQISRVGLIVNELATNALKYGAKSVRVGLAPGDAGKYCLIVSDDGAGLPAEFDVEHMSGLGKKGIASLVRSLGGTLSHESVAETDGTRFKVSFLPERAK